MILSICIILSLSLSFSKDVSIYLKVQRKGEKGIKRFKIFWFTHKIATGARVEPGPSLELHLGLPHEWQGPQYLVCHWLFFPVHQQKLDRKWDSSNTNRSLGRLLVSREMTFPTKPQCKSQCIFISIFLFRHNCRIWQQYQVSVTKHRATKNQMNFKNKKTYLVQKENIQTNERVNIILPAKCALAFNPNTILIIESRNMGHCRK